MWAISPSGSFYACADDYYPGLVLRIFRMHDAHLIGSRKLDDAYIEDRNSISFLDDKRLAFTAVDDTCNRDRISRMPLSVVQVGVSAPIVPRVLFHCASGVIGGNSHVAYLRSNADEYALDGKNWTSQHMYGLDQSDSPLTDESPLLRAFRSDHPDFTAIVIGVGLASPAPHS